MDNSGFSELQPKFFSNYEDIELPCVIKKKVDEYGANTFIAETQAQLDDLGRRDLNEYIFQEYIPGLTEYAVHFYRSGDGEAPFGKTVVYGFKDEFFVKGKTQFGMSKKVLDENPGRAEMEQMLQAIDYVGVGCLNFKIHKGVIKVFEVNPRMGASLNTSTHLLLESILPAVKSAIGKG